MAKKVTAVPAQAQSEETHQETVAVGTLIQLDPSTVLADDNTRYNLKQSRIEALAQNIVEQGGVLQPVEVEPIVGATNGHSYRLTTGFMRHAAVLHLNTTAGAGLTLPAIVRSLDNSTPVVRIKRQLSENMERENMSPMDTAVAIKKLLDAGVVKMDVRLIFARGKKGTKVQPASNSYINMMLSFLTFPAKIRNKIHDGTLGTKAAYEMTKSPAEKWDAILEVVDRDRTKELEREEKDEKKFLSQQSKEETRQTKVSEAQTAVDKSKKKYDESMQKYENTTKQAEECYKISKGKHPDAKTKKTAESQFKTAEQARKTAEADAMECQTEYEKSMVALTKLTQAPNPAPTKPKKETAVSQDQVKKAAKEVGATQGAVILTGKDMRKVVEELALPSASPSPAELKVTAIGKLLVSCFAGILDPKTLVKEMIKVVK